LIIIGLDIGGSTTKSVLLEEGKIKHAVQVSASEPIVSAAGAVGKLLEESGVRISEVSRLACTGGGARVVGEELLGMRITKVGEIEAIGIGGLELSGLDKAVVVSVGTGTAVVAAWREGAEVFTRHLGGTGVGGGTLVGLAKLLLGRSHVKSILSLSMEGDPSRVDLTVGDIVGGPIGRIPASATASNFGKVGEKPREQDVAAGLVNMVGQVIATVAYFAARAEGLEKRIVFTGILPTMRGFSDVLLETVEMFGGKALVPQMAAFATAIGAAIKASTL